MEPVTKATMMVTKENTQNDNNGIEPGTKVTMMVTKENTQNDINKMEPVTKATTESADSSACLIVIGGKQNVEPLNTVDIYTLSSGNIKWSHKGEPLVNRWIAAGRAVKNGNIYMLGGFTSKLGDSADQHAVSR